MGGPHACATLIACALLAASGNRLKPGLQEQLGPDLNVKWRKGAAFICLQKWERRGQRFTKQFCLADLQEVLEAVPKIIQAQTTGKPAEKMRVANTLAKCQSKRASHLLKVCDLKGKEFSYRLSYSDRAHVPKICFSKSAKVHLAQGSFPVDLVQSAVKWKTCNILGQMPALAQNAFLDSSDLGETVSESSSTTTTSLEIEDFVQDISIEEESSTTTTTTTTTIAIVASLSTSTSITTTTTSTTVSLDLVSQILRDNEDGMDGDAGTLVSILDGDSDSVEVEDDTAGVDIDNLGFQQLRDLWRKREQRALANPSGEKGRILHRTS